jgi:hypothetical protein
VPVVHEKLTFYGKQLKEKTGNTLGKGIPEQKG